MTYTARYQLLAIAAYLIPSLVWGDPRVPGLGDRAGLVVEETVLPRSPGPRDVRGPQLRLHDGDGPGPTRDPPRSAASARDRVPPRQHRPGGVLRCRAPSRAGPPDAQRSSP